MATTDLETCIADDFETAGGETCGDTSLSIKNDTSDTAFIVAVRVSRQPGGPCSATWPAAIMAPGALKSYSIGTLVDATGAAADAYNDRTTNFMFIPDARIAFVQVYTATLTELDAIPAATVAEWSNEGAEQTAWETDFWSELGDATLQGKIVRESINCFTMTINTCTGDDVEQLTLAGPGSTHSMTVGLGGATPGKGKTYRVTGAARRLLEDGGVPTGGAKNKLQITLHNDTNAPSQEFRFASEKVKATKNTWGRVAFPFLIVGMLLTVGGLYLYFSHKRHFPVNPKSTFRALGKAQDAGASASAHTAGAARGTAFGSAFSARNAGNVMPSPGSAQGVHLSSMVRPDA